MYRLSSPSISAVFDLPSPKLVFAIKRNGKENVRATAMLLFYFQQKNITLTKFSSFCKIYCHMSLLDPKVSGGSVASASHVHTPAMLLLLIVGK
jgi:hypothetical protein